MAIVFIHGVATRSGASYKRDVLARNALFKSYLNVQLGLGLDRDPINVYWGEYGAQFRWDQASLPRGEVESFGTLPYDDLLAVALEGYPASTDSSLCLVASESVERAIDLLWMDVAPHLASAEEAYEFGNMARLATDHITELNLDQDLAAIKNDLEWLGILVEKLNKLADKPAGYEESFGGNSFVQQLTESIDRMRSSAGRLSGKAVTHTLRERINQTTAIFFGDAFVYLDKRGTKKEPGQIIECIVRELENIPSNEPLDLIAHSLGGLIAYDILSYYRPDIKVRNFVTIGSQVGFFEELCLLKRSEGGQCNVGPGRTPELKNINRWINVFDKCDFLAFATEAIFSNSEDYQYSTGKGVFTAHSSYLNRPSFYRRLAERIGNQ